MKRAGPGLVFYHPKGAMLRNALSEDLWRRESILARLPDGDHRRTSCRPGSGRPSGHYGYYKENMYTFNIEEKEFVLKPMNCPGHILIYKSKNRSYRDLPIRFFESSAQVYRTRKPGAARVVTRARFYPGRRAHILFARTAQARNKSHH